MNNTQTHQKEMSVYDLATLMMGGFDRMEQKMATKDDLASLKKELKSDIAELRKELKNEIAGLKKDLKDTNRRLDNSKLFIPSLI